MKAKYPIIAIFGTAIAAGAGIWYTQEYGYYAEIDPTGLQASVRIETAAGAQPLAITDFQGIDADSSPLRWRACFTLDGPLPADVVPFEGATPLYGPGWFDCFDAEQIGEDIQSGAAQAILSQTDIHPDVDRVLAIYPDGRAFGWQQYNDKTPERGVMD